MNALKHAAVALALTCTALGCSAPMKSTPSAFLSRTFEPSVRAGEALVAKPSPPEPSPPVPSDLRSCALASTRGAPIMERSDATTAKRVALTFDDGPHVSYTPGVLDALKAHQQKATFFLVGRAINGRTFHLVQRTLAEGHSLGIHSYNHEVEMATHFGAEKSEAYIVGQYEVTRMLIELAWVATSETDFDAQYTRVFGVAPYAWISEEMLATQRDAFAARHAEVLSERGFSAGTHPVDVVFWRPPGGGPYLGKEGGIARKTYDAALRSLGAINVIWHGGSGDTDAHRRHDKSFLLGNLRHAARQGGVLLLHDPIDKVALRTGLAQLKTDGVEVVSLETLAREKFGCR